MYSFFDLPISYLQGLNSVKASLLKEELQIITFGDLIRYYPFRYEDRTRFYKVVEVTSKMSNNIQLKGVISSVRMVGIKKTRLVLRFRDETGEIDLVWFQGIQWVLKKIKIGIEYVIFGKPVSYDRQQIQIVHPELTICTPSCYLNVGLTPIYRTSDKLKKFFLDSKVIARLQCVLLDQALPHIKETIPDYFLKKYSLISNKEALQGIHAPRDYVILQKARFRLKFEELFYIQLHLLKFRSIGLKKNVGKIFDRLELLNTFYENYLSFELTNAQKRVIRDIYNDLKSGKQMNRLLQGDVGSGKTIVAWMIMLIVISSGAQVAMMVPTEILAEQHYVKLQEYALQINISIAILTGSTGKKKRCSILQQIQEGSVQLLIGTHALLGETIKFKELGFVVVDEQHRFGVAQRASLWMKNKSYVPHMLIMTATPIPRTLSMTLYGDLDISIIDEMPIGKQPIKTVHYYENKRLSVLQFLRTQIALGRQAYIVYPLIEESAILDYKNLMDGYESICRDFPSISVGILHGKMHALDKAYEMKRFLAKDTLLLVATTVIEVGIHVPNATVILIEDAERFGLAQLHQLRGRVGRGVEQAYCILMTGYELNEKSRVRIQTMVNTNNGFEIANIDLKLRGPGDLLGTQQSGVLNLKIADLGQDGIILQKAREAAKQILTEDPNLMEPSHLCVKEQYISDDKVDKWGFIG